MEGQDGFYDTHSHILFSVDDGAADIGESIKMIETEIKEGVGTIFLTPHFYEGKRTGANIRHRFDELRGEVSKRWPKLRLFLGNEIFCMADPVSMVKRGEALCYDGGRHVLLEFSPANSFEAIKHHLECFIRESYIPVIAHAERYPAFFSKTDNVRQAVELGALIQINSETFTSSNFFTRRHLKKMLEAGLIFCVGTDAHNTSSRAPAMRGAFEAAVKMAGKDAAIAIFLSNPKAFINNGE